MATKCSIVAIQMDAQSKARLEKVCERLGMTQLAVTTRMAKWFLSQDDTVQAVVLGSLSKESMRPLVRTLLQRVADASRK
jgi:precorrin-6B methylase 2